MVEATKLLAALASLAMAMVVWNGFLLAKLKEKIVLVVVEEDMVTVTKVDGGGKGLVVAVVG